MQETAVRFAICDDDKIYAEKMKALILQTFQLPQPVECVIYLNQEQILKCYREDKIDIVFMDIEFGDTIGFQVARRLSRQDSQLAVVYMTNYEHYITEAFVCRPLGFIRKSHAEDDLQIAGQEIRHFIGQKYSRFVFGGGTAVVEVPLYKVYAVEIYGHDMVILLDDENIRVRDKLMRVEDELEATAKMGYTVMIKATAGGGGKGMRIARNAEELPEAYTQARAEAKASFTSDEVYIEKYLENPRHVEMQILADKYGNVVHLGERDRKSTRLNSSHEIPSRMPSSA